MQIRGSLIDSIEGRRVASRFCVVALALMLGLSLSSCDLLLDAAIDCLDDDRPQFNRAVLPDPILNQAYRELIQASIKNEPNDDSFEYDFFVSGSLPEGLVTEISNREVLVIGTPVELGSFTLGLFVKVISPPGSSLSGDDSGLCKTTLGRNFDLTVQEM